MESNGEGGQTTVQGTPLPKNQQYPDQPVSMRQCRGVDEFFKRTGRLPHLRARRNQLVLEINIPGDFPYRMTTPAGRVVELLPGSNLLNPPLKTKAGDILRMEQLKERMGRQETNWEGIEPELVSTPVAVNAPIHRYRTPANEPNAQTELPLDADSWATSTGSTPVPPFQQPSVPSFTFGQPRRCGGWLASLFGLKLVGGVR
jgi:hypothetical protein